MVGIAFLLATSRGLFRKYGGNRAEREQGITDSKPAHFVLEINPNLQVKAAIAYQCRVKPIQ